MLAKGIQKVSLIDYPGKVSATIFTSGCNFRCGFCHNPELALGRPGEGHLGNRELLEFLESRRKWIDGICISGGEPTLDDSLPEFAAGAKRLGLAVKIDTNGSNPEMLKHLIDESLADYIAMDIKAPLERYPEVCGTGTDLNAIKRSIELLLHSPAKYEFRTTLVPGLHSIEDAEPLGLLVKGARLYALQQFRPSGRHVDPAYKAEKPFPMGRMLEFKKILENFVELVEIRGQGANI